MGDVGEQWGDIAENASWVEIIDMQEIWKQWDSQWICVSTELSLSPVSSVNSTSWWLSDRLPETQMVL